MQEVNNSQSFTKVAQLFIEREGESKVIGFVKFDYLIALYDDIKMNGVESINQAKNQKFIVNCTQRIILYNPKGINNDPSEDSSEYLDYPAMLDARISLENASALFMQDYSPVTVNTEVQTSGSVSDSEGQSNTSSKSSTVGSSISSTQSFDVTIGMQPSASAGISFTQSSESSRTKGAERSANRGQENSLSESMSIKDWGAYSYINPNNSSPNWTFGQEYPWSAIQCRKTTGDEREGSDQVQLEIPTVMLNRLYDGVMVYPPSELSTYGLNFVMKATWLAVIQDGASDEITLDHTFFYYGASHLLPSGADIVNVYIDPQAILLKNKDGNGNFSTNLSLNLMALESLSNDTILGFLANKFIVKPALSPEAGTAPALFKIISDANDLLLEDTTSYPNDSGEGAGFIVENAALIGNLTEECTALQITLYFKVIDVAGDIVLYLKHWKTGGEGIKLTLTINEETEIVQYIDDLEAEGGENNTVSVCVTESKRYANRLS